MPQAGWPAGFMGFIAKIWQLVFPRRASTQTWMILTFALFVGIAVAAVGLYTVLVLRGEIRDAARETLLIQAEHIAAEVEGAATDEDRARVVHELSHMTGFRITVSADDTVLWDIRGHDDMVNESFLDEADISRVRVEGIYFDESYDAEGRLTLYVALYRPESDMIVRIGQLEPPAFAVVRQMQMTLLVGMSLALLLAIIGSWIAARQITTPLQAIRRSARRINEGYLDEKIEVHSRAAEFQDLSESLNLMAERFRNDISELQRIAQIQNEFIGNVSHEVKNPIFAVSGYLEALGSPGLKPEQRQRYAEKGLFNLQRLNNLFSDLIEIAKLEYREDLISTEVFDLNELIDDISETVRMKAEEKGLELETENDPLFVEADRNRVRQVLTNLIENAIAYTDRGVVRCRFRKHRNKVRIEVVDTGRGIGEEHLDRIFERFYRVDTARSRKQGGTGLGLSIVKQILHAHGENIHVESTLGRGTRFWFELPWKGSPVPKRQVESEVSRL